MRSGPVSVVRPPLWSRIALTGVGVLGLILSAGSVSDSHPDAGAVASGVIFVVGGLFGAFARAECTTRGVVYRAVGRWTIARQDIRAVTVEQRGWTGTFPTLVVYRHSGRPLVLRAVSDFRSAGGRARQDRCAQTWRDILELTPAQ